MQSINLMFDGLIKKQHLRKARIAWSKTDLSLTDWDCSISNT